LRSPGPLAGTHTVGGAFREFLGRIELNPTRVQLASERYAAMKGVVEKALPGKRLRQVGSFQRQTKIRPADLGDALDIDAVVVIADAHYFAPAGEGLGPDAALEQVRSALVGDKRYRLMRPRADAPTVSLAYADDFAIELIPAFVDKMGVHGHGSAGPDCYLVGSATGDWVPADYDYDAQLISGLNNLPASGRSLVPAIKMVKFYLRQRNVPLKSFHVEILVALTLPGRFAEWASRGLSWDYSHALAQFLSDVPYYLHGPVSLLGSFSPPVGSGLASYELEDIGRYLTERAQHAWRICATQTPADAISAWRRFIGDPFPAC
jgi:hypothetical protein